MAIFLAQALGLSALDTKLEVIANIANATQGFKGSRVMLEDLTWSRT